MAGCFECYVRPCDDGGWMARTEVGITGPYMSLDFALRVAVSEALRIRGAGRMARIAVLDCNSVRRAKQCVHSVCVCENTAV